MLASHFHVFIKACESPIDNFRDNSNKVPTVPHYNSVITAGRKLTKLVLSLKLSLGMMKI